MYQSEFADRMLAHPGTPDCGRLSLMVQTYCAAGRLFDLPPQAFSPQPRVRSTVVHLIPRDPLFPIHDRRLYADVVRALFSHRRKTVRTCLKSAAGMIAPHQVELMLAGLPEDILSSRPEALYLEDFATIANWDARDTPQVNPPCERHVSPPQICTSEVKPETSSLRWGGSGHIAGALAKAIVIATDINPHAVREARLRAST
jgi:hypothetical protein